MQCSPAFPMCRSHIPPQPACLPACLPPCLAVCVFVCVPGSVLMVMECCLCAVCMDSSLLPEDGGGDPTGEAVIVKSSVNRGHPRWMVFEIAHIIALKCNLFIVAIFWQL